MYIYIKSFFDFIFSFLIILILSPLFIIISLILLLNTKSSPYFMQKRAGFNGLPFYVIKFKTMSDETDEEGNLLSDSERITKIGRFVRNSSLDELPQILNILKGDMSLVGPRPFLYEYMDIYTEEELRRHHLKPGITGWAQINGRNSLTWKEKFKLDLYYVDNVSFYLDLKILAMTLLKIIKKSDVNQDLDVTMEKYNGKN